MLRTERRLNFIWVPLEGRKHAVLLIIRGDLDAIITLAHFSFFSIFNVTGENLRFGKLLVQLILTFETQAK